MISLIPQIDDPNPKRLTPQQMKEWNMFVDFLDKKGIKGSGSLNNDKTVGKKLFDEFKKSNPGVTIDYSVVPSVQYEMHLLQKEARRFDARRGNPDSKVLEGISKLDGWMGSKTSSFKFPDLKVSAPNNPNVIVENKGLVNGDFQPVGTYNNQPAMMNGLTPSPSRGVVLPKGVRPFKVADSNGNTHWVYENEDGDLVPILPKK